MSEIFEIEIYRKDKLGASTTLKLPATSFEITDALDKLRITDSATPYQSEILSCELDYPSYPQLVLRRLISDDANLYELNHLAERLDAMGDWELDCFEGMTIMDAIKKDYAPLPLERLINMTHSTGECQIAYDTNDDKSLGKLYVDNGMSEIPDDMQETAYELLDYEAIGRKARTGEGGVFTEKGYVVHSGEMSQAYQTGSAIPQGKPNHTIEIKVCKGYFNDPAYDNKLSEFLLLPADDGILDRAIAQVEAASIEECSVKAVDCIVPRLSEIISDALCASNGDCYGAVNELATQLQRLEQSGKLYTYKAMVEAAPQDITLEEAIDLSQQVDWFSVTKEATSPAAYAKDILSKYCIEQADELFASTNLHRYGEKLIAEKGVAMTEYGALWSYDGQTVEQRLCRTGQGMTMEMK